MFRVSREKVTPTATESQDMLHGLWNAIRDNADKIFDNVLGLCRDAFILVLGIHYRHHMAKRNDESKDSQRRHQEAEDAIRELQKWMDSEHDGEHARSAAAGKDNGVDIKPDIDTRHRNRVRKP